MKRIYSYIHNEINIIYQIKEIKLPVSVSLPFSHLVTLSFGLTQTLVHTYIHTKEYQKHTK